MTIILIILVCIVWYIIGLSAFYWDWTRQFDLTTEDLALFLCSGFIGPIAWIVAYFSWRSDQIGRNERIIFKQRNK